MSVLRCATYGFGACTRCCELNSFRYKSNLHFRMWQVASYRDRPRVPWETMLLERERAVRLGQVREPCG